MNDEPYFACYVLDEELPAYDRALYQKSTTSVLYAMNATKDFDNSGEKLSLKLPSQANGDRLKIYSRRSSGVRIPSPAYGIAVFAIYFEMLQSFR